jgi:hypothetical protein
MAVSSDTIAALDVAIASSVLEIEVDGIRTKYRSVQEMLLARQHLVDLLAGQSATRRPATRYFRFGTQRD